MSRRNGRSLHHQVDDILLAQKSFGRSKHEDKRAETVRGEITSRRIYSGATMDAYRKAGHAFVNWIQANKQRIRDDLGHTPRSLAEVRVYVPEWVREQIGRGLSAYTINMRISAISRLYNNDKLEDCPRPSVGAQKISRSRHQAIRDYGFSEVRHADLVAACRCCGFRRHEAVLCRPEHLRTRSDGSYELYIKGKGGRERYAPLTGSDEEIRQAVEWIRHSSGANVIPSHMDVHSYRAEYAARVYHQYARKNLDALKGQQIDYTAMTGKTKNGARIYKAALLRGRGAQKGRTFDRYALIRASQALGHNRESVVVSHYSYRF